MAAETFAPSVYTVFFCDATTDHELMVAAHAYVVVAGVAFQTVVPRVGGRDGIPAYVAQGGEGERAEYCIGDGEEAGTSHERF